MSDIPEEVRKRMVRMYGGTRILQRYQPEERQWPRNLPHPSGKRPIYVDLVHQELWVDPTVGIMDMNNAPTEWRDVYVVPEVEGLPADHDFTEADLEGHRKAVSLASGFKGR